MKELRRKRLTDLLNGPRFNGDRRALYQAAGISKGRLTQLLDPNEAFGDVAATNLCESLALPAGWFDSASGNMAPKQPTDVTGTFKLNPAQALVPQGQTVINNVALSQDALRLAQWLEEVPDPALKARAYAECMGIITRRLDEADRNAERAARVAAGTLPEEYRDQQDAQQIERRTGTDRRVQRRR